MTPGRGSLLFILLAVLCVAHIAAGIQWIEADRSPLEYDESAHSRRAFKMTHAFTRMVPPVELEAMPEELGGLTLEHPVAARTLLTPVAGGANTGEAFFRGPNYPPLPYMPVVPLASVMDSTRDSARYGLGLFWLLAAVVFTALAARAAGARTGSAFLAGIVIGTLPMMFGLGRTTLVDVALVAMTAAGLWGWFRAENFENRNGSILFGAIFGMGMLAKQPYVVLFALPGLIRVVSAWRHRRRGEGEAFANLGLAAVSAFFVCGPWYVFYTPGTIAHYVTSWSAGAREGDPSSLTLDGLLYYPQTLVDITTGPIFAAVGAIALAAWLVLRDPHGVRRFAVPSLIGTAFFFIVVHANKDPRYVMQVLPLFAVMAATAIDRLPHVALRGTAIAATGGLQILVAAGSAHMDVSDFEILGRPAFHVRSQYCRLPDPAGWGHDEILDIAMARAKTRVEEERGPLKFITFHSDLDAHGEIVAATTGALLDAEDGAPVPAIDADSRIRKAPVGDDFLLFVAYSEQKLAAIRQSPIDALAPEERFLIEENDRLELLHEVRRESDGRTFRLYEHPGRTP